MKPIGNTIKKFVFRIGALIVLVSLTTLLCCNECPQDDGSTNIFDSGFFFELHDKTTDENLLNLFFGRYNQDTVKILREDLSREESFYFVDASGRAWFRCLENPEDLEGLKRKVIKTFFLYLDRLDTDTIRIEFTLKDGDCPTPDFDEVLVFFNGKLNTEGTFGSKVEIPYQIFKK